MSDETTTPTRRDALKATGVLAAASAMTAGLPGLYAADTSLISIAVVGCGGRGTGAAADALATKEGPVQVVAMADVLKDKLDTSFQALNSKRNADKMKVSEETKFLGFDAYKKAIDLLQKGDVVILATPPAFRWVQFKYAIEKGVHVFMEKPVCVDGPTAKKMFALGEESVKKNLKVGVGLMCRHCEARGEMHKRVKDGAIGDIQLLRAYRMAGPTGNMPVRKKPADMNELEFQLRKFHGFLWLSGGAYSDFLIHNIDECCWFKDSWPIQAKSNGGRHYREGYVDQNFDSYSTEFTFPDGAKLYLEGRTIQGCHNEFASYCHGTKGSGVISESGHWPSNARLYKSQNMVQKDLLWSFGEEKNNPYRDEWNHLLKAIREDKPYNEVQRGTEASLVTAMGRMSAHTGQVITREMMLECDHEFAPNLEQLKVGGEAPIKADDKGMYPLPNPGKNTKREY